MHLIVLQAAVNMIYHLTDSALTKVPALIIVVFRVRACRALTLLCHR